jgi:hypothetical protein
MRGIKKENILLLAKKDVERIKQNARIVWQINEEGEVISSIKNDDGRIYSLAVIGPASLIKEEIKNSLQRAGLLEKALLEKELLLLEIGLKRGKPYRPGFNRENGKNILLRRKWFFLSEKQYLKLAPNIFCFLLVKIGERIPFPIMRLPGVEKDCKILKNGRGRL